MATTFTNQATLQFGTQLISSNIAVGQISDVIEVTKQSLSDTYTTNDTLVYTVSVRNLGETALSGLTVTDDLGAYTFGAGTVTPLSYVDGTVTLYINGALQPAPIVTTTDGLAISGINIPALGNAVIIYSATLNSYAPLETDGSITNTVTVTGAGAESATAQDTVSADENPILSMAKSISPIPVTAGSEVTYTLVLSNAGNTAVLPTDNAVITDTFAPLLTGLSATLDGQPMTLNTDYTYNATSGEFATMNGALTIPAATFTQDPATGEWSSEPGTATLVITGTLAQ